MNKLAAAIAATCMALAGTVASAQDATKAETKMEAKKSMSTQDCKDHMNTATGQKRTDPSTAETADKCADMKNAHAGKMHKSGSMKKDTGATQEQPAAPSK